MKWRNDEEGEGRQSRMAAADEMERERERARENFRSDANRRVKEIKDGAGREMNGGGGQTELTGQQKKRKKETWKGEGGSKVSLL